MAARDTTPLTQARLRELLHYDPDTGLFTRRIQLHRWQAGTVSGFVNVHGYVAVRVDHVEYYAHRLAFLYMTGEWPKHQVDHKDHVRSNNRWGNLRDVTSAVNNQNHRRPNRKNKLGVLGVHINNGCIRARLQKDRKVIELGYFDTVEEAHAAYLAAKRLHHPGNTL